MKIIEIITSIATGYIFNYDIGIITFFTLKSIFSNNYKISLFMLLNLFVYLFFGLSYILFTKLYLLAIISIFFYDNIIKNKKNNNISKLKSIYSKIIDFYNLVNIMLSLPIYIIYDNINYLLEHYGYRQKILNNRLVNKFNKKYILMTNLSNSEMSNFDNFNNFDNCENKEFDKLLNVMVNPDKFFDMANDMRESIGKKRLTNMRFSKLMENNNNNVNNVNINNVDEVNSFFKMFGNSLDKLYYEI